MQANVDEVISSLSLLEEELVAHFLSSRLESPLSLSLSLSLTVLLSQYSF